MGLDIYHCRATLTAPNVKLGDLQQNIILESEYEYFDVPFSYFSKHTQYLDYPLKEHTIILPQTKKEYDDYEARFTTLETYKNMDKSREDVVYQENKQREVEIIKRIEDIKKAVSFAKGTKQIYVHDSAKILQFRKKPGGYTIKNGISTQVSERLFLGKIFCYTTLDVFECMYNSVDFYWDEDTQEDVDHRKMYFKSNFIDEYKEGASFLITSY